MLLLLFLLLSILSQTGAGKTHTMIGTAADPGVMVLSFRDLFEKAGQHAEEHRVKHNVLVSFLEIYNENIFDLLVSFALVLYLVEILFLSFDRISSHYISFLCARVLFFFPNYRTHLSLNHLVLSCIMLVHMYVYSRRHPKRKRKRRAANPLLLWSGSPRPRG